MDFKDHLATNFSDEIVSDILSSLNKERTYGVLLNTNKISISHFHALFPSLKRHPFVQNGFLYDQKKLDLNKHLFHDLGLYYLQDPSAMATLSFLNIKEGDLVLDLCAAPGGKTIQTSLILKDSSYLIANDISFSRTKKLISNVERLGLGNVIIINNDFAKIKVKMQFDKIILDAPCSGSMMFRKNLEVKKDWSLKKVLGLQIKQIELIKIAYNLLKPGGELIYSTCSFSKEENEDVILSLLKTSDASIVSLEDNELVYESRHLKGCYYLLPSLFPGEGQFICKIKKPGQLVLTKKPPTKENNIYLKTFKRYGLENRFQLVHQDNIYSLPFFFTNKTFNILRLGLKAFLIKGPILIPHHHLSRFLSAKNSLELTSDEIKQYFRGEELKRKSEDGYYLLSYQNLNVAWSKAQNNTLKNLLPKGLRKFIK